MGTYTLPASINEIIDFHMRNYIEANFVNTFTTDSDGITTTSRSPLGLSPDKQNRWKEVYVGFKTVTEAKIYNAGTQIVKVPAEATSPFTISSLWNFDYRLNFFLGMHGPTFDIDSPDDVFYLTKMLGHQGDSKKEQGTFAAT